MKIRVKKALGRGVEEEFAEMPGKGEKCRNAEMQTSESQVKKGKSSGNHEIGPRPVYMGASIKTVRESREGADIAGVYSFLG